MPAFEPFAVVAAPFPYVERPVTRRRPALVVGAPAGPHDLVWVLMITSAENAPWPLDVPVSDLEAAGLPVPSVVRCTKVATVESSVLEQRGMLAGADQARVACNLHAVLAPVLQTAAN